MQREKELVKNTIVLSAGRFLPKLTSFITLPILTACLTKAEYGTYDLVSTLVMLIVPIATLQIQSAAFRFLIDCRKDLEKIKEIISSIFVVTVPAIIVASIIVQCFFRSQNTLVRVGIAIYFILDTLYLTLGQIVRGLGKNRDYSIASLTVSVVNMICVFFVVKVAGKGLFGVVVALCVSYFMASIYLIIAEKIVTYISLKNVSVPIIRELLAYSWPMVPNNLSTWVLKLSDRLVITAFLGVEANAIYSVANKIPSILSMAQEVIVMAWQENASIAANDSDVRDYYSSMLDKMFSLMFGCTALLIAGTPIMFVIMVRGDYSEAYYQMPVLILAMFFFAMSSYFGGIYIARKKTTNVGISTMVAACINLAIDLALVKIIGIWAGSISTLVAYLVLYVYRMFNIQRFQSIDVNYRKQVLLVAILIVMLAMCFVRRLILDIINLALGVLLFCVFNRELIMAIFRKIKKNGIDNS